MVTISNTEVRPVRRVIAPYEFERMCRIFIAGNKMRSFIPVMLVLAASTESEGAVPMSELSRNLGLSEDAVRQRCLTSLIESSYLLCFKSADTDASTNPWMIRIPTHVHTVDQDSFDGRKMMAILADLRLAIERTNKRNQTSALAALILVGLHMRQIRNMFDLNSYIGSLAKSTYTCARIVNRLADLGVLTLKKSSSNIKSTPYITVVS